MWLRSFILSLVLLVVGAGTPAYTQWDGCSSGWCIGLQFVAPLPSGSKVLILGDSIVQQNGDGTARSGDATQGGASSRARGELTQVLALDPRFNAVNWYNQLKVSGGRLTDGANQGVNSDTSVQAAARMPDVLARAPDVLVHAYGTNNTTQKAQILADLASNVSQARAAGIRNIVATIRPNTVANQSPSRSIADIIDINNGIRSYVSALGDSGVILWDAYAQYNQGDGFMDPLNTYDRLLHPNEAGAELGAWGDDASNPSPNSLAAAIRKFIRPGNIYTAIMAANANILVNPTLTGTGGTLDTGFVGVAPSNWRWDRQGTVNSTCVASVVANPETGGQSAQCVITPVGSAEIERINFRISAFTQNVASLAGKWVRFFAEIETDGTWWLMAPTALVIEVDTATPFQSGWGFQPTLVPGTGNFISGMRPVARTRQIMSEPVLMGPSATGLQPSVQFAFMPNGPLGVATGTATVRVKRTWMATVPDPRPAWNQ